MHRFWLVIATPILLIGCDESKSSDRADDILSLTGDPAAGELVYAANCEQCHGVNGLGENDPDFPMLGEDLREVLDEEDEEVVEVILYGEEEMPAFEGVLSDQEIADVIAFIREDLFAETPGTPEPNE